jgi:hypothetical protein
MCPKHLSYFYQTVNLQGILQAGNRMHKKMHVTQIFTRSDQTGISFPRVSGKVSLEVLTCAGVGI